MSIDPTSTIREVVVEKTVGTTYVCDHCGARWDIGTYDPAVNIGSLHPPKSWWRVAPADSSTLWEGRRTQHVCSRACLAAWALKGEA